MLARRQDPHLLPAALLLALATACGPPSEAPPPHAPAEAPDDAPPSAAAPPAATPADGDAGGRLVVLVAVDQLGADHLDLAAPALEDGLARLLAEGVVFTGARHAHAVTTTAPGHATLVTGRHPRHHGIIDNYWYEPAVGEEVYAIDDDEHGESPAKLLASTLGDWLAAADPASRTFAVAGKDRAAVLLAGHAGTAAYWYDEDIGGFATSSYYRRQPAGRLAEWNATHPLDRHFGATWEPLPVEPAVRRAFGVADVDLGPFVQRFPHVFGDPEPAPGYAFYDDLRHSPFLDVAVARFAEHLAKGEALGRRGATDLLAVGFSALDIVGHRYGRESPEVLDTVLRLDRTLGALLDALEAAVGRDRLVVALSADHGVGPLPEADEPGRARRLDHEQLLCVQRAGRRLAEELGPGPWLGRGPAVDRTTAAARGVEPETVEQAAARHIAACSGVDRAWTRSELAAETAAASGDRMERAFALSFDARRSPDFLLQFEEGLTPARDHAATHGSPWPYDQRVPLVLRAPGLAPRRVDGEVLTVDLAPTLAGLVGIDPPLEVDGRDLLTEDG